MSVFQLYSQHLNDNYSRPNPHLLGMKWSMSYTDIQVIHLNELFVHGVRTSGRVCPHGHPPRQSACDRHRVCPYLGKFILKLYYPLMKVQFPSRISRALQVLYWFFIILRKKAVKICSAICALYNVINLHEHTQSYSRIFLSWKSWFLYLIAFKIVQVWDA